MSAQTDPIQSRLLIVLALITGIALTVAINTEFAKNLGADIFVQVILKLMTALIFIYTLKTKWVDWRLRIFGGIFISALSLSTVYSVTQNWTRLPWVKAEAFNTANSFLNSLKGRDGQAALAYLTVDDKCVTPSDLLQPNAQPVGWVLTEMDKFSNIIGSAVFTDGEEANILLRMKWMDNRWRIDGMIFGIYPNERLDVDFLSDRCPK